MLDVDDPVLRGAVATTSHVLALDELARAAGVRPQV
jgi:hypothetical protein